MQVMICKICKFFLLFFSWLVSTFTRHMSNLHTIQDELYVNFLTPQLFTRKVPRPGLQDLSPSLLLSVSSIQKPHCGIGGDWWWAEEQRLVLRKALRGAVETLHTRSCEKPDIESRVSEQWTAGCASDAEQGFRKCTQSGRWVAVRNTWESCL